MSPITSKYIAKERDAASLKQNAKFWQLTMSKNNTWLNERSTEAIMSSIRRSMTASAEALQQKEKYVKMRLPRQVQQKHTYNAAVKVYSPAAGYPAWPSFRIFARHTFKLAC